MVTTDIKAINTIYNVAYGERNTLNDLITLLKECLSEFDKNISNIKIIYGPNRAGDIPHSHASIDKAKDLLDYNPQFSLQEGLKKSLGWHWRQLKSFADTIWIIHTSSKIFPFAYFVKKSATFPIAFLEGLDVNLS